jgi:ribosomal protein S18 acetylase RimI-like enzyme
MPDGVVVRCLAPTEGDVLRRVARDVFDHDVRADYLRAFLDDPHSLLAVAVDDGVVVGMASGLVYGHPDKPLQLFVAEVGVAPAHQGRGLGRELVRCLLARARALGCAEAWVATEEENAAARRLYAATGGREEPSRAVVFTYGLADGEADDASRGAAAGECTDPEAGPRGHHGARVGDRERREPAGERVPSSPEPWRVPMRIEFRGEVFTWRGPAPFFFVAVPEEESREIQSIAAAVTYGWGMVPVRVRIGATAWRTSLFPKDGRYLVPLKDAIRKAERIGEGDEVAVRLEAW